MKLGKKSRLNSIVCAFILVVGLICSTLLAGVTNIVFAKDEFENPIKNYQLNQSSNSEFITTLNNWTKVTYNSYNADNYNSGAIKWSSIQNAADESDEELWDDYKLIEAPGEVIVGDEDYNSYLMINAYSEAGRLGYKTSQSFSLDANSYYSIEVTYKTIKASNEKGTSDSFASIYLKDLSNEEVHELLKQIDFNASQKIHPNNRKRVERAIELFYDKDEVNMENEKVPYYDALILFLDMPRDELYNRINHRVDLMVKEGLIEEFEKMYPDHLGLQASRAIGIQELIEYKKGNIELNDAIELIKQHSRNYAKRQITWFKHKAVCRIIDKNTTSIEEIKKVISDFLN